MNTPQPTPIATPCTGVCRLDMRGYCVGCSRTGDEIMRWVTMGETERARLMHDVLPQRAGHEESAE